MTSTEINPVEQIVAARRRLQQVAALRAGLALLIPALTALMLAAALEAIGAATWERMGYLLAPAKLGGLRLALLAVGVAALAGCAVLAWQAYRQADDFMDAAERVDEAVGGHQEIITLASFTTTAAEPNSQRALRTPLFPLLWRRAIGYLERFDPRRAFALDVRRPLLRSLPIAGLIVVVFAAAALALVRPTTAEQLQARKLRTAAKSLASSSSPADKQLASKILAAAEAIENPKLPPEEKLEQLAEAMRELQKQQQGSSPQQTAQNATGKGNGNSNGNSSQGNGQGNGPGQGQDNGQGQGNGQGQAQSQGQNPNGPKGNEQMVELRNDISKAQAQIEAGAGSKSNAPKPGQDEKGGALKPGNDSNHKGSSEQPDALAQGKIPRPGTSANGQMPSGGTRRDKNEPGGHGDTHLGEMPAPENFQRFYQPGHGPPIEIRDARYVVFRLPTEVVSANGGKNVPDTNRPTASVPYANVPLKAERLDLAPEERQLVPPRYRDLIR